MKVVADTLGVACSNLVEQTKRGGRRPRPPYRNAGDAELLARIRRWSTPGRATATGGSPRS
jgi:putative transposase